MDKSFQRFCEEMGLDEDRLKREQAEIEKKLDGRQGFSSNEQGRLARMLALLTPQQLYLSAVVLMPETMKHIDVLLLGSTPIEELIMKGEFLELPPELQTPMINALHWRQADLRQTVGRYFRRKAEVMPDAANAD